MFGDTCIIHFAFSSLFLSYRKLTFNMIHKAMIQNPTFTLKFKGLWKNYVFFFYYFTFWKKKRKIFSWSEI